MPQLCPVRDAGADTRTESSVTTGGRSPRSDGRCDRDNADVKLVGGPKVLKFAPVSLGTICRRCAVVCLGVAHNSNHQEVALNAVVALLPRYYGRPTSWSLGIALQVTAASPSPRFQVATVTADFDVVHVPGCVIP